MISRDIHFDLQRELATRRYRESCDVELKLNIAQHHMIGPSINLMNFLAVRGHLKTSHIADKRKNFHMGGREFEPDSLCDRQSKKKKNRSRSVELAGWSNLQRKCCKSLSDLQGGGCTHANVVDQSQMSIALLKALVGRLSLQFDTE